MKPMPETHQPRTAMKLNMKLGLCAVLCSVSLLQACIPLAVTAVGAGVLVGTDRRSGATQLVDKEIQFKASSAISGGLSDSTHVNITSFNRMVLLTGEVSTEAEKKMAEDTINRIVNVRGVTNELNVAPITSVVSRTNDVYINGKIKATFVDAKDLFANSFKIVVENKDVFLMGLVTEREGNSAAELASRVKGVNKVVKVFELISEDELKRMGDPANARPAEASNVEPKAEPKIESKPVKPTN
jgi:osmotically-inducible protein OsmY